MMEKVIDVQKDAAQYRTRNKKPNKFLLFRFIQRFGSFFLLGRFNVLVDLLHLVCLRSLKRRHHT